MTQESLASRLGTFWKVRQRWLVAGSLIAIPAASTGTALFTTVRGRSRKGFEVMPVRHCLLAAALTMPMLGLSACGGASSPSNATVFSDVYTSAAMTITAQSLSVTPTATLVPTATATATAASSVPSAIPTPTAYSSSYVYAGGCNNAAYVDDVTVSDGTVLAPGEIFTKTWEFQNTGSCAWRKDYSIAYISGDDMGGADTELGRLVNPGVDADVSVSLTAPDDDGNYIGYWQLVDKNGTAFGEQVYVQIVVSGDAATSTPTSTPSPTATPSPEQTATGALETPTSTIVPNTATRSLTDTPTLTPTSPPAEAPSDTATAVPSSTSTPTTTATSAPSATPTITPDD